MSVALLYGPLILKIYIYNWWMPVMPRLVNYMDTSPEIANSANSKI